MNLEQTINHVIANGAKIQERLSGLDPILPTAASLAAGDKHAEEMKRRDAQIAEKTLAQCDRRTFGGFNRYPIADREAGALHRLAAIVSLRNNRNRQASGNYLQDIIPYRQPDCRGCMLYLVKRSDLGGSPMDQVYTRGLAVCA